MSELLKRAADPISFETHFIGACLSFIGLIILLTIGMFSNVSSFIISAAAIFVLSMIALYSASSLYHYFYGNQRIKRILRKLDHSMIYVLIVGTYTPVVMYCMKAPDSYYFLGTLWFIALLGIVLKVIWIDAPRFITTLIYLILGWSLLFDFSAFSILPIHCFFFIAMGGIAYSLGAFVYIFKKPNISQRFGFHELFHIFVMLGSFMHYMAIVLLII